MATSQQRSDLEEQRLIEQYVDLEHVRWNGRAEARLKSGPSIWFLVRYLDMSEGDVDHVAQAYELSLEEMEAMLAYYRRNKKYVDARILVDEV